MALAGCAALSAQTTVFEVSTFAGAIPGTADGWGSAARFDGAGALAVDSSGAILVLDRNSNTVRRVTSDGRVDTVLGVPRQDGPLLGADVVLGGVMALAVDEEDNFYVAAFNGIHRFTSTGVYSGGAGGGGYTTQLFVETDGTVRWVATDRNQVWSAAPGGGAARLAGSPTAVRGWADGAGDAALFDFPTGIARGRNGAFYVADQFNYVIRRVDAAGVVTTLAGLPDDGAAVDGTGAAARFSLPTLMSSDAAGNGYVVDRTSVRKVTPAGVVTTIAGDPDVAGNVDGAAAVARFHSIEGIVAAPTGDIYVADNNALRKISPAGAVSTVAGRATAGPVDGPVSEARFTRVTAVAGSASGTIYVADARAVRRIVAGVVSTFAGSVTESGSADGTGAAARFNQPSGLAVDEAGNVYVADERNHNVRKITPAGAVTTLAGKAGESGDLNGVGEAARFWQPRGVAVDSNGNVYVADMGNCMIRKITPAGVVSTLAGQTGVAQSVDGVGSEARFRAPTDIAIDASGNLWVADGEAVRKVTLAGAVTTLVSSSYFSFADIAAGPNGDLYAIDTVAYSVRRITPDGAVTAIAGGQPGSSDGRGGTARFRIPEGIWVSAVGEILVGDLTAVRRIVSGVPPRFDVQPQSATLPAGGSRTLTTRAEGTAASYRWLRNGVQIAGATNATYTVSNLAPATSGLYAASATRDEISTWSNAAIVGVSADVKALGAARELTPNNIVHPNGNIFDQVLLEGAAASITADAGQVTRMSFIDLDDDIVQVEFSGPGTLTVVLEHASGPTRPRNYKQAVDYMKGRPSIVITGADERTNVAVFTVGRATAIDPTGGFNFLQSPSPTNDPANNGSPLFVGKQGTLYDGIADIGYIAIASTNGKFGGVHTSNASYSASAGWTGVYAPGVAFQGPLYVGDVTAYGAAVPVLVLGSVTDSRITGGDLFQDNHRSIQVAGLTQLRFTAGTDSHGRLVGPRRSRGNLVNASGEDVTSQIVVSAPLP